MLRRWQVWLLRTFLLGFALCAVYAAVLCVPQPLFGSSVRTGSLWLYSDQPLSDTSAANVLRLSLDKLAKCPLYAKYPDANIFICNSRWRQMLFFNKDYGVGGVSPYPVTSNVFLRNALLEENRLISPRGTPVA